MLASEFIKLANADCSLESLKRLAMRNLKPESLTEDGIKKLMHVMDRTPRAMFTDDLKAYEEAKLEDTKKWAIPDIKEEFASAVDFNEQTQERIIITIEDYQKYFDDLLSSENESDVALNVRIASVDKSESFNTMLWPSRKTEEFQNKYPWLVSIASVDSDLFFLVGYAMALPDSSSSALNIPVTEAIARGRAQEKAFRYVGKLLNSHLSDLFKDFFSESRS